jgi:uncharacterized membrane protein
VRFRDVNGIFLFAVGIGIVAGLRSLTAPAVTAWAAHLGWVNLDGTPFRFMGSTSAVAILSLLAIAELIADKLPKTPSRTAVVPLLVRILTGGLCGACLLGAAHQSAALGALLGAIGAVIGTFGGYEIRKRLVNQFGIPDIFVAIPEDLIAIGLALFLVSR